MEILHKIPLLRPLIALSAGIVCGLTLLQEAMALILVINAAFFFLLWCTFHFINSEGFKEAEGFLILICIFSVGAAWTVMQNEQKHPSHFSHHAEESDTLIAKVIAPPSETENSVSTDVEIRGVSDNEKKVKTSGRLLLYLEKSNKAQKIQYGDILIVKASYDEIEQNKNPYGFDFRNYQFFQQTYHNQYSRSDAWSLTSVNKGNTFFQYIYQTRNKLLEWQQQHITNDENLKVANALLTGYREDMSGNLRDAYAASGAMHILAVSGLHTGLVFMVFYYLLAPLTHFKYGNLIKTLLLIAVLWIYACLTGLQPSVCRAATMLSFVVIGMQMGRLTNVFQSLTISAFLLLLINPYFLVQPGFQLSYAAVTGIVLLMPRFQNDRNSWAGMITGKIWTITLVSIAAQLFTAPLVLHYFGQFPPYFILTNLVALPFAALTLYCGLAFFALKAIGTSLIADFTGQLLNFVLSGLNFWVFTIDSLPGSPIQGLWITVPTAIAMFGSFFFLIAAFNLRKSQFFITGTALSVFVVLSGLYSIVDNHHQKAIYIPDTNSEETIAIKDQDRTILLMDETGDQLSRELEFTVGPFLERHNVSVGQRVLAGFSEQVQSSEVWWRPPFGQAGPYTFMVASGEVSLANIPEVDLLIVKNNAVWEEKNADVSVEKIIFGPAVSDDTKAKFRDFSKESKVQLHDVSVDGAFLKNW